MRGLGTGLGSDIPQVREAGGPVLVWSENNVINWAPVNLVLSVGNVPDPETGLDGVAARETAVDDQHYIFKFVPVEMGKTYRLRFLVRRLLAPNRDSITINLTTGAYWVGTIGSAVPDFESGFSAMEVGTSGLYDVLSVQFTHAGATGNIGLSIGPCAAGPLASYLGVVTKGLDFGNVKLYDITG
jgi:hypothetical protein